MGHPAVNQVWRLGEALAGRAVPIPVGLRATIEATIYPNRSRVGSLSSVHLDTFAKIHGSSYFAERKLLLDGSETRPPPPGT